ncbi:hypothetical protein EV03_0101 [Prochlorococcus marinus str. PAC1]|uniref:Uncharacterized protein n=1 Tax=Prochlorococcus marinus str. PAC1 TaxID=59924 RepID=A0A0A2C7T4_PROMR|nr:hypothetical protein EV03_0101 [Prochlorococcus marinus str. PAC1]
MQKLEPLILFPVNEYWKRTDLNQPLLFRGPSSDDLLYSIRKRLFIQSGQWSFYL